jgi:hypothetical protein
MANTSYFVRLFERRGDQLATSALIEASDYVAAIGEAIVRAQEAAGAIAFARIDAGHDASGLEIIIKIGDVPDTMDVLIANV